MLDVKYDLKPASGAAYMISQHDVPTKAILCNIRIFLLKFLTLKIYLYKH